jgi:hypothetical protein
MMKRDPEISEAIRKDRKKLDKEVEVVAKKVRKDIADGTINGELMYNYLVSYAKLHALPVPIEEGEKKCK